MDYSPSSVALIRKRREIAIRTLIIIYKKHDELVCKLDRQPKVILLLQCHDTTNYDYNNGNESATSLNDSMPQGDA